MAAALALSLLGAAPAPTVRASEGAPVDQAARAATQTISLEDTRRLQPLEQPADLARSSTATQAESGSRSGSEVGSRVVLTLLFLGTVFACWLLARLVWGVRCALSRLLDRRRADDGVAVGPMPEPPPAAKARMLRIQQTASPMRG